MAITITCVQFPELCTYLKEIGTYFPIKEVDPSGFEPETSCLQGRRSPAELCAQQVFNNDCELFFNKKKKEVIHP